MPLIIALLFLGSGNDDYTPICAFVNTPSLQVLLALVDVFASPLTPLQPGAGWQA